ITADVDVVLEPDGDVDLFFVIAVEISEEQAVGSVGIVLPPFENRSDILAPCILDLGADAHAAGADEREAGKHHRQPPTPGATPPDGDYCVPLLASFVFRISICCLYSSSVSE